MAATDADRPRTTASSDDTLDAALELLSRFGPELQSGMTNHAPMVAEALCALGRPEAVVPWIERYRRGLQPRPRPRERIERSGWAAALGRADRAADWSELFAAELAEAPWRDVLGRWAARLAPGISADATHGVIRVGHAARGLRVAERPQRLRELADGLGAWAASYQTLPTAEFTGSPARPQRAIAHVPVVPPAERTFCGTIVSSLEGLGAFPAFAPVIGAVDVGGDAARAISDLTETFARVYLANARDPLRTVVFVHGVTSTAALRSLLDCLPDAAAGDALRYAWQAGCALYSAFGDAPVPEGDVEPPRESREALIDRAIAGGDEHAIKFTEACFGEFDRNPLPVYLAAARHAVDVLAREVPGS